MAETKGAAHSDECEKADGGICLCSCGGSRHGVRLRSGKLRKMGDVKVSKARVGGKEAARVVDQSTGRPPGGGTKAEKARAPEKPTSKPDTKPPAKPASGDTKPADKPAGARSGALADMSADDQQRIRNAVADRGPGIYGSPMVGGSKSDVGRYLAEGELGKQLADRHDWRKVWQAVSQVIDEDPEALKRSPARVKADTEARTAKADEIAGRANAAVKAGDTARAAELLDEAAAVDPDHVAYGRRLAEVRDLIRKKANEKPDAKPAAKPADKPADKPAGKSAGGAGKPAAVEITTDGKETPYVPGNRSTIGLPERPQVGRDKPARQQLGLFADLVAEKRTQLAGQGTLLDAFNQVPNKGPSAKPPAKPASGDTRPSVAGDARARGAAETARNRYGDGDWQFREAAADLAVHGVQQRGNAAQLAESEDARRELVEQILDDIAPSADRDAMRPKVDRAVQGAAAALAGPDGDRPDAGGGRPVDPPARVQIPARFDDLPAMERMRERLRYVEENTKTDVDKVTAAGRDRARAEFNLPSDEEIDRLHRNRTTNADGFRALNMRSILRNAGEIEVERSRISRLEQQRAVMQDALDRGGLSPAVADNMRKMINPGGRLGNSLEEARIRLRNAESNQATSIQRLREGQAGGGQPSGAHAARIAEKEQELAKATEALRAAQDWRPHGSMRTKSFGVRVDANLKRSAAASATVQKLTRELEALRRDSDKPAAVTKTITAETLKGARLIKDRYGWYEVEKVNRTTVKYKGPRGMDNLMKISKITDYK